MTPDSEKIQDELQTLRKIIAAKDAEISELKSLVIRQVKRKPLVELPPMSSCM